MEGVHSQEEYWTKRYIEGNTGWDIGSPSTPLRQYIDQIEDLDTRILIPGAGNAYEAEYLHKKGFNKVYVLDISNEPLDTLSARVTDFPKEHLLKCDFFNHAGTYDLILEQTFFCSFEPSFENRYAYFKKSANLLSSKGLLVGLWFKHSLQRGISKRPFGGSKEEYLGYLKDFFHVNTFEDCYNSISPRRGNELFGIFEKM